MGDVIRRTAAADDILNDVRTTYAKAMARTGAWRTIAETRLGPMIAIVDQVEGRLATATTAYLPLKAALDAFDDQADAFLGRISDNIWNDVGRPAQDASLSLLFPGGLGYYTDGPDQEQPARMELLAELLEAHLHPQLPVEQADRYAAEIRAMAAEYEKVATSAATAQRRKELLERIKTAIARAAQMELVNVKRRYKAEGFSEADIHTVIPDRPIKSAPSKPSEPEDSPQTPPNSPT